MTSLVWIYNRYLRTILQWLRILDNWALELHLGKQIDVIYTFKLFVLNFSVIVTDLCPNVY